MSRIALASALLAVLLLAGCGRTATATVERPPNLGAPGSDAHDTRNGAGPNDDHKPFLEVTVTGVGFFDRLHGQTGVAPNGLERHPLTSIEFPQVSAVAPAHRLTANEAAD
jgi:hypothetical protein